MFAVNDNRLIEVYDMKQPKKTHTTKYIPPKELLSLMDRAFPFKLSKQYPFSFVNNPKGRENPIEPIYCPFV